MTRHPGGARGCAVAGSRRRSPAVPARPFCTRSPAK